MVSHGLNSLQYSGFHVNHIDLTPKYAPLLYGVTNSVANTGQFSMENPDFLSGILISY